MESCNMWSFSFNIFVPEISPVITGLYGFILIFHCCALFHCVTMHGLLPHGTAVG